MNELLSIDTRTTVIVTVDMQNDYRDMKSGTAPVAPEDAQRVIELMSAQAAEPAAAHWPVINIPVQS